ncbi:MAG: glycine cleavage system protein GcvH [Phycisphaerae bacterium]
MSDTPTDRKYLVSHEWHKVEGDVCTIGITSIAAEELTDITYVDLPEAGTQVTKGQTFGEIESVKATSDLYAGVSGEVIEVNAALSDDPSLVNNDPHGAGWMLKVKMSNPADTDDLLDNAAYLKETGHA